MLSHDFFLAARGPTHFHDFGRFAVFGRFLGRFPFFAQKYRITTGPVVILYCCLRKQNRPLRLGPQPFGFLVFRPTSAAKCAKNRVGRIERGARELCWRVPSAGVWGPWGPVCARGPARPRAQELGAQMPPRPGQESSFTLITTRKRH